MIVVMKNSVATFIIRFDLAEAVRLKTEDHLNGDDTRHLDYFNERFDADDVREVTFHGIDELKIMGGCIETNYSVNLTLYWIFQHRYY